ncbi:hypothetical protein fugu_006068 [Takifugu bimaculatus]|uniref:MALT paracaspase 2 n=1 Tax=Takifugu bimaculatus TaxID=433685 RepID=A0A4Z2B6X1_9TELE|nr:hypothetical protein fugu_006068 [Takifugu bimaculatus]
MEEKSLVSLGEHIVNKLALMLDRSTCGWRQLASTVSEHPKFRFSENELTSCSLQVLRPTGSPGRAVLAVLADRFCSLNVLLDCLRKIDHQEAVQYLTSSVAEIQISVQPQSQQAAVGSRVSLTCRAFGPPDLNYQWFRGKEEILGERGTSPELILCPLAPVHQGHYICRINNGIKCIFSQWAHISVIRSADCSSSLLTGSVSGLFITSHPQSQVVSEGDTLFLECNALANPPAQYRWHHNMVPMEEEKSRLLQIPCLTTAHRGQYRCKIFNLYHEAWTDAATITIGEKDTMTISEYKIQHSTNRTPLAKQFYATDKIALLIGNMNYIHHTQLCAPIADVHELTNLLTQMDFKVVSLLDLNWQEMHSAVTEFLLLLDKGVYGLLYFAGHGYENYGNSFMVPIDAPASYTSEHCVCVQSILTRMQEKQTGLNIFLLDMCRKRNPNDDIIVLPGLIKVTANIVFGYATCVDAEAYEVKREDVTNGIFISFLKRRVCEDEKVTVMLDRVAEDMGRFEITRGRQALELRSNLSERRSLTDPIMTPENCSASSSARNLQWAVAHVLPQSLCLQFDCGVKVQLGFAAEFSNVMVIYTRILEKPKEVSSCCAQLTDFPENEFTFTTCLHYNYSHMNEEVQERQTVTVGKPLVSKLNLHEPRPSFSASSFICRDSLEFAPCSSITEDLISAGSNACPHSAETDKKHQTDADFPYSSIGSNTPVETEASEIVDAPQPLVTGKSLPHNQINDTKYNFSDINGFHSY